MGIFKAVYEKEKEQLPYFYWISMVSDIGIRTYTKLQSVFNSPKELFYAGVGRWEKSGVFTKKQLERLDLYQKTDPEREYEKMIRSGISFIPVESDDYPGKLKEIPSAPIALFLKGRLPHPNGPVVSVIGARACSQYGEKAAYAIGEALGGSRITLVSGMARGIDSISQIAALNAGGYSLAVLGGGVDVIYPRESRVLYERLCERGGVISEFAPGTEPKPQFFAARNRIISGLSDVLCVVEAREKSGTMITVDAALEQGREVYTVPGRITDPTSRGCLELIKQGAGVITDVYEFVNEVMINYGKPQNVPMDIKADDKNPKAGRFDDLSLEEKKIVIYTDDNSFTADEMSAKSGLSVPDVVKACVMLTVKGLLVNMGAGRFNPTSVIISMRNYLIENKT